MNPFGFIEPVAKVATRVAKQKILAPAFEARAAKDAAFAAKLRQDGAGTNALTPFTILAVSLGLLWIMSQATKDR